MRASTVAGEPSLVRLLTMITFARLPRRRISRSAPRPSSRGMETSSVTTSGLSDSAWATASRPSWATPTTSTPGTWDSTFSSICR